MEEEPDNVLIKKQWGYQTICPDEEEITGLYQIANHNYGSCIYGWKRPSLKSDKHDIKDIIDGYCVWGWEEKYNKRDGYNWVKVSKNLFIGYQKIYYTQTRINI